MSFLFFLFQHDELWVSPLRRVCRIVHLQKECFKDSKFPQESPCVLANFLFVYLFLLVWDFLEKNIPQNQKNPC